MQAVSLFYIQEILIYGNKLVFIVVHFQIAHGGEPVQTVEVFDIFHQVLEKSSCLSQAT